MKQNELLDRIAQELAQLGESLQDQDNSNEPAFILVRQTSDDEMQTIMMAPPQFIMAVCESLKEDLAQSFLAHLASPN